MNQSDRVITILMLLIASISAGVMLTAIIDRNALIAGLGAGMLVFSGAGAALGFGNLLLEKEQ